MAAIRLGQRLKQRMRLRIFLHDRIRIVLTSVIDHDQTGFSSSTMFLHHRIPVIQHLINIITLIICRYDDI